MRKEKIKVLHLASFVGNVGDLINHIGTRNILKKKLNFNFQYTNLEFRSFFWKLKKFDNKFINLVNKYDLLMIGGGGFLELWPKNSKSGTSVNLGIKELKKIQKPILFYALGSDLGQGTSNSNILKFKKFTNYCLNNKKIFFTIRNDGSSKIFKKILESNDYNKISIMPDGGFFFKKKQLKKKKKYKIGVNLAGDMLKKRYQNKKGYFHFLKMFSKFIKKEISKNNKIKFIFFSHIWKDYSLLMDLIKNLSDEQIRKNVQICGLGFDDENLDNLDNLYQSCDLILANRFHSHILAMVNKLPLISINNYPQIKNFYEENKFGYPIYNTNDSKFFNFLHKDISSFYKTNKKINEKFYNYNLDKIQYLGNSTISKINQWLKKI